MMISQANDFCKIKFICIIIIVIIISDENILRYEKDRKNITLLLVALNEIQGASKFSIPTDRACPIRSTASK